jgi:hypothetical protein
MWIVIGVAFGWLMLITVAALRGEIDAERINALAGVATAFGVIVSPIIMTWFAASEYGRVNGVLGTTVTTETSVSTNPQERPGPKE